MNKQGWAVTKESLAGKLTAEEARILDMLIDGKSTVEISRILGQHRSMIWRKAERIRKSAAA